MSDLVPALSQRLSRFRANGRLARDLRVSAPTRWQRTSLAETMAVGLGCDNYKYQR